MNLVVIWDLATTRMTLGIWALQIKELERHPLVTGHHHIIGPLRLDIFPALLQPGSNLGLSQSGQDHHHLVHPGQLTAGLEPLAVLDLVPLVVGEAVSNTQMTSVLTLKNIHSKFLPHILVTQYCSVFILFHQSFVLK